MRYLAGRGVQNLMGPTDLLLGQRVGSAVGISVRVANRGFDAVLEWTRISAVVNSPKLNDPSVVVPGERGQIGSFGVVNYSSRQRAYAKLQGMWNGDRLTLPSTGGRTVTGLDATEAVEYDSKATGGRGAILQCRVGQWEYYAAGLTTSELVQQAQRLLPALHRLPNMHGRVEVQDAGDGTHALVAWVQGNELIYTTSVHSAQQALTMAESMRRWTR
jgi:hypothetical protein